MLGIPRSPASCRTCETWCELLRRRRTRLFGRFLQAQFGENRRHWRTHRRTKTGARWKRRSNNRFEGAIKFHLMRELQLQRGISRGTLPLQSCTSIGQTDGEGDHLFGRLPELPPGVPSGGRAADPSRDTLQVLHKVDQSVSEEFSSRGACVDEPKLELRHHDHLLR